MLSVEASDENYPKALTDLVYPPKLLYALGDLGMLRLASERLVAIVGTREATPYGLRVTAALAAAFANAGIGVVSGLARGIDSAAHRAALDAGGATIAVQGTGADVPYPAAHRGLHGEIAAKGLVISESEPGTLAFVGCFPRRNRIIAALAKVTIVVEAPYKSGAINTATQALTMGRTVAAVPGPIDSPRSAGCNLLLRDGAQVIATVDDALALFGHERGQQAASPQLGDLEAAIWEALAPGPAAAEVLGRRAGLTIRQVLEGVARLEIHGLVGQLAGGEVQRLALQ